MSLFLILFTPDGNARNKQIFQFCVKKKKSLGKPGQIKYWGGGRSTMENEPNNKCDHVHCEPPD